MLFQNKRLGELYNIGDEALKKLDNVHDGDSETFTPEEIKALREVANVWRGYQALGALGTAIRKGLWLIGAGVAVYLALQGKFDLLIKSLFG
jgi:hypothetical protein